MSVVDLTAHKGRNMATGKEQTLPQYQVILDGQRVGFLGWGAGKKICFTERLSPIEQRDVETKVQEILKIALGQDEMVASVVVPDVPPELLQDQSEDIEFDDFD